MTQSVVIDLLSDWSDDPACCDWSTLSDWSDYPACYDWATLSRFFLLGDINSIYLYFDF